MTASPDLKRPISRYLNKDEARRLYQTDDSAHDFDHVLRVAELAVYLARNEGANVELAYLSALLHDVPVSQAADTSCNPVDNQAVRKAHHLAAAEFAQTFLRARGMPGAACNAVAAAIASHRFRDRTRLPESLEARILYDADKLDSMGAIGIGRAFAYAGHNHNRLFTEASETIAARIDAGEAPPSDPDYTPVHEYVYKLRRLLDTLHTSSARRIGMERHAFMESFFSQLEREMTDER